MANRETQVDTIAILVGNPKVRATNVDVVAILGANPGGRTGQVSRIVILPNIPTPPAPILEFLMP
jgi:hypothetical protein